MAMVALVAVVALLMVASSIIGALRGARLVRFIEVASIVTIVVAAVGSAVSLWMSLVRNTTTVVVALETRIPEVRLPGLIVEKSGAVIVGGGADRATMTVTGVSWTARLLLAAETLTQAAVTIFIALVILRLARNIRGEKPFNGLAGALTLCGVTLFIGSIVWSVLGGSGSYMAGLEALQLRGIAATEGSVGAQLFPNNLDDLTYYGWPSPTLAISIPFWPLGVAAALALLGAAFRTGARLQADTEGLV